MKKSVICILGIIFITGLAITTTAFAIDLGAPQAGPKTALKNLPSTIKIDPNVIKAQKISSIIKLSEFKQKWKSVTDGVAAVNALIPGLEQVAASMKQKEEECKNKQYTTADITAACAQGADTIDACSRLLFFNCCRAARNSLRDYETQVLEKVGSVDNRGPYAKGVSHFSNDAGNILVEWREELNAATSFTQ